MMQALNLGLEHPGEEIQRVLEVVRMEDSAKKFRDPEYDVVSGRRHFIQHRARRSQQHGTEKNKFSVDA